MSQRFTQLCTVALLCDETKDIVTTLKVEMMNDAPFRAKSGRLYRILRFSVAGAETEAYDWGVAFAGDHDLSANGKVTPLDIRLKIGGGSATQQWVEQKIRFTARHGQTVPVAFSNEAPAKPRTLKRAWDDMRTFDWNFFGLKGERVRLA